MTVMKPLASIGLALVIVLGATVTAADTHAAERYSFARPAAPASTVDSARLSLTLNRHSTDAERARLQAAIADEGVEHVLDYLRDVSRLGTLTWPGGGEYAVRYARKRSRP